jgi:dipeptidyl aminopeptidase/acylaminoacyl peptidase
VRIAVYALVFVVGFLLVTLAAFWLAVRPPRLAIPHQPGDFGLAVEDVTITAPDGVRLAGWLVPRPGTAAVVFLHGYPANKADMLPLAATLAPRTTVLLLDLRYFGASGGRATTLGHHERGDLRAALDVLAARGYTRVGVFGFSLGGAVALMTAAEDARVAAVVAYAPFADLRMLGRELYAWLWLLRYPLVETMVLWGRLFLGVDITSPSPVTAARALRIPVLLVHGPDDEQIPFSHGERLREALAANPRAEFVFTGLGRHGMWSPDLDARIAAFLDRALGTGR